MDGDLEQRAWPHRSVPPAQTPSAELAAACCCGWASSISDGAKVLHLPYAAGPTSPAVRFANEEALTSVEAAGSTS